MAVTPPLTRVDPHWLALRGPADERARAAGAGLVDNLARFLAQRVTRRVRLMDVGAGTGAGASWLRPRLSGPQDWRLVDADPALLQVAPPVRLGWADPVVADIAVLPELLAAEPADAITCQALLDLLTATQIEALVGPATACHAAVLLSLTVTGRVALTPGHPDDHWVATAFNAHQRRSSRLGPDAARHAAAALRRHGYSVTSAATPWHLDAGQPELTQAWLAGRASAAAEQDPQQADRARRWLRDRLAQVHCGDITATVEHVDLLGIPTER